MTSNSTSLAVLPLSFPLPANGCHLRMVLDRPTNDSERLHALEEDVGNDIHDIISPRSSSGARTAALKRMEVLIGSACVQFTSQTPASGNVEDLHELMRLQDGFECNLPSKLLPWISLSSPKLENLSQSSKNSGIGTDGLNLDKDDDYSALKELTTQLCLSLSIVQGVALNHPRSKRWLGKIKSLEILVDLLLASRHVPSSIDSPASSSTSSKRGVTPPSLTSAILDTMLCILVDSTPALRAFEECNGVQAIVKILKRAGSPREVRMKCLEFLYFYLLDETKPSIPTTSMSTGGSTLIDSVQTVPNTPSQHGSDTRSHLGSRASNLSRSSLFPPTVPNTPREKTHSRQNSRSIIRVGSGSTAPRAQSKKPYLNGLAAPIRPSPKPRSEYGSSTFSFPHSSYSGPSVRSEAASEKGYITESSPSSRSNSNHLNQAALGRQVVSDAEGKTLRSVSSGSTKSFTSTSSTTSAASTTSSATTAPGSAECSPKKPSGGLPLLPTIPSGTVFKTPPGSPEMEFAAPPRLYSRTGRDLRTPSAPRTPAITGLSSKTPSGPPRTPASKSSHHGVLRSEGKQLFPSGASGGQARSLMMLAKDVDFVPQSPQKMQTFRRDNDLGSAAPSPSVGVSVGTVTGMGGRRTRTHSRTRSAFALGATSTRISSRASSRERGHSRARSVGRAEPELSQEPIQQVEMRDTDAATRATAGISLSQRNTTAEVSKEGLRMDIRARTTEEKKELLGTMLGNVDALVEGVRKAGIWGLG
ncbi:cell division control protein 14, SIN component-domain-containing protein [Lentinula edodes]|uniref:Cell division control protein 14, SIN component-domain-containing protein n=1 Tax=Lentinula lateritia TaxID=40482 RepID=A0A9W9A2G7_9AGAR|nr:cell division control protein 14, SIN component-domain-containing protein [Lentinula edodes]